MKHSRLLSRFAFWFPSTSLLLMVAGFVSIQIPAVQRFLVYSPAADLLYRRVTTDPNPYGTFRQSLIENFPGFAYAYITQKVVGSEQDPQRIVLRLAEYVHENLFNPPGYDLVDEAPIEVLRRGLGWCDQSAHLLVRLVDRRDIPARLLFLKDNQGISPHSVASVYFNGDWRIVDPWVFLIPRNQEMEIATWDEIFQGGVTYDILPPEEVEFPEYPQLFVHEPSIFLSNLASHPSVFEAIRKGEPPPGKTVADSWQRLFALPKPLGSDLFIDFYVQAMRDLYSTEADYVYGAARTYHILGKYAQARRWYARAAATSPGSRLEEEILFFAGLAAYQQGRYRQAQQSLDRFLRGYPRSPWVHAAQFFAGKALYTAGQRQAARPYLEQMLDSNRASGEVVRDAMRLLKVISDETA